MQQNALISIIVSVVTSGVVAAVITYILNATEQRRVIMRQKAEDLFYNFEVYYKKLTGFIFSHYGLIKQEISESDTQDMVKNIVSDDMGIAYDKLRILTRLYYPEALAALESLVEVRTEINSSISDAKRAQRAGVYDRATAFPRFHEATGKLEPAAEQFRLALLDAAKKYSRRIA